MQLGKKIVKSSVSLLHNVLAFSISPRLSHVTTVACVQQKLLTSRITQTTSRVIRAMGKRLGLIHLINLMINSDIICLEISKNASK